MAITCAVCFSLVVVPAAPAGLASTNPPSPQIAVYAGSCALDATATQAMSPAISDTPASVALTITGSSTCVANGGITSAQLGFSGTALLGCAGGEGSLGGSLDLSNGVVIEVAGQLLAGPQTEQLILSNLSGSAVIGSLAWTSLTCALTGSSHATLSGSLSFVYA